MKRTTGLFLATVLIALACTTSASAVEGEQSGIQIDLGLGFTSGYDAEKLSEALGLGKIDGTSGASLRFGATYKLPLMENFYLNPTFNMGFFSQEIDYGGMAITVGGQNYNLNSIGWSVTQINFGVHPVYYFMPPTAKFRPYGGLGIKLNINSTGKLEVKTRQGDTEEDLDDTGKTSVAIGPMVGFDYMIKPNMSIPLWLQYDLYMAEDVGGVFMIMTGASFYF